MGSSKTLVQVAEVKRSRPLRPKRRKRQQQRDTPSGTVLVLGAAASRSVSYAHTGDIQSPLDYDFFDLLQRLSPNKVDVGAVDRVLSAVRLYAPQHRRSMEKAFYTLHLRSYLSEKLGVNGVESDRAMIRDFACAIQALLRAAHGKKVCCYHSQILNNFHETDAVISFNYDLVAERAIRKAAETRQ